MERYVNVNRRGGAGRVLSVLAASTVVTTGLFVVMQALVANDGDLKLDNREPRRITVFVQNTIGEPEARKIERIRPPVVEELPPVEPDPTPPTATHDPTVVVIPRGDVPDVGDPTPPVDLGMTDGDMLPIVSAPPEYPACGVSRGLEGYAIVSMTVEADGTTSDIAVLESEPGSCFNRSSVKAALKFRYKPRVINGKAQRVENVTYRFIYKLDEQS